MDTIEFKTCINTTVNEKVSMTQKRREYKESTRGVLSEYERGQWFLDIDNSRHNLRQEIRSLLLAYGYLRGLSHRVIENNYNPEKLISIKEIQKHLLEEDKNLEDWYLNDAPSPYRREQ